MAFVVTLENFTPVARQDSIPWTEARIEEGATIDGAFALIETITLSPVDTDPEHPQARAFTTELATAAGLWYRVIFVDATGDVTLPTVPIQNVSLREPYASVEELARILKIRAPISDAQTNAMERVLLSAAGEIDAEIDRAADDEISGWELELAAQVNLERAAELWQLQEIQFGIVGLGSEFGPTHIARNTWDKHAYTLASIKGQWGLA